MHRGCVGQDIKSFDGLHVGSTTSLYIHKSRADCSRISPTNSLRHFTFEVPEEEMLHRGSRNGCANASYKRTSGLFSYLHEQGYFVLLTDSGIQIFLTVMLHIDCVSSALFASRKQEAVEISDLSFLSQLWISSCQTPNEQGKESFLSFSQNLEFSTE